MRRESSICRLGCTRDTREVKRSSNTTSDGKLRVRFLSDGSIKTDERTLSCSDKVGRQYDATVQLAKLLNLVDSGCID